MTPKQASDEIKFDRYVRIPNFISSQQSHEIEDYVKVFIELNYTEQNLKDRLCFKQELSETRQGDAFMVSLESGELPSISIAGTEVEKVFKYFNSVLGEFTGSKVSKTSRCMMNAQQYFSHSKEVIDHFDGEYLDFSHEVKNGQTYLNIKKALLPRLVAILVLRNENEDGTYVRLPNDSERIPLVNKSLDLIIFDNTTLRHGVPELEKPRMMIGFRNFDHNPVLFSNQEMEGSCVFVDELNPGFQKHISSQESIEIQKDFHKNLSVEEVAAF